MSKKKSSVYLWMIISRTRLSSVGKLPERPKVSRVPRLLKTISQKIPLEPNLLPSLRLLVLLLLMVRVRHSLDSQELRMKLMLEEGVEEEEEVVVEPEVVLMQEP